jgi:hypothetical protein
MEVTLKYNILLLLTDMFSDHCTVKLLCLINILNTSKWMSAPCTDAFISDCLCLLAIEMKIVLRKGYKLEPGPISQILVHLKAK